MAEIYRRRASSNYFELDADRRRNKSERSERFSNRLTGLDVGPASKGKNADPLEDDEVSIDFCCELLKAKFGFQEGSVANQREHVLLLLANGRARAKPSDTPEHHVIDLHKKLMSNYMEWCKFLNTKPVLYRGAANGHLRHPFHMDILLYFLIWGEAGNVRHMPECLCYLYHQMMTMVNADMQCQDRRPEGWYLTQVIRPIWNECSNMKRRNGLNKPLEHVKVRNYDDINEYFWKQHCLTIDITKVGRELSQSHGKTFYEHRSIFTLVLNYYRIFQFNMMFLILLTVLAFAVTISPDGGKSGFNQFGRIGDVVEPFKPRDLKLAVVAIVFSHALLAFLKCVLEAAHGWHLLISREASASSSRSLSYGSALFIRLLWNGAFSFLFGYMIYIPLTEKRDTELLSKFLLATAAFAIPGGMVLLIQAFSPQLISSTFASKFVREGESCYVGRHMSPPLSYQIKYILYWAFLWSAKAVVSYFILVRPLMLPSLAIYEMNLNYENSVVSFHNIGVILALWLPVVFIFNYDTQIYFTILQALLGAFKGLLMKTGEVRGAREMAKAFRVAPQLFDQKIVTSLARSSDAAGGSASDASRGSAMASAYESQMMLRFVVVWNEIVNSFREGDLLDDKEAAILQYDIRSNGEVFEPVFLSAGKLGEAMNLALKTAKEGKGESQLRVSLVESDCLSAIRSFVTASAYVLEALFGNDDADVLDGFRVIQDISGSGGFMKSFNARELGRLRAAAVDLLEEILDLPDPDTQSQYLPNTKVHTMGVIRNFVTKTEVFLGALQAFCLDPALQRKFSGSKFCSSANGYVYASRGLVNLFASDTAMGAATRACLLLSLEKSEAMPRCLEAQRRLGFFMKSLAMDIPQLRAIKEMRSFSVVTPFYAETVLFSLEELNNPLVNHPIFQKVEEDGKNLTILKYLNKIHPEEWENFLERVDVATAEEAQKNYPQEIRLWASYRGQTLARTVQGMMMYEDAIKILHWLEIGSSPGKTADQKQMQLQDMVRLKFSYICACQVYGKHRRENKQQADDIDYLLREYPNLRVAYVDTIDMPKGEKKFDTVLIKSENDEIVEVYRYELPGDPILGEGKPENQNNAVQFTRGEFVQTIDMNQEHYFEECLKMPQLLRTADLHPSKKPVSIIGMREHIFTGNASSLAKFKTWQELVFVTLSQRVLADPLWCRMHYGHPDVFDKVLALTRGGVSKASKGINLSEDVFAGFNSTLRGGVITHVEFMQCGKGRDVALSQISMFEGKLANGAGETSLARDAHRMGQFMDFFRLNSMYYSHTGFYFATWMTIVTTFVYMYSKVYLAVAGVQEQIVMQMNLTDVIVLNERYGFDSRAFHDTDAVVNTQFYIQAGLFLSLPLIAVYFGEMGIRRGLVQLLEMIVTGGPAFFIFQVGTTMHYFDNNLLHGEAQYKATGRGFKITRETFVLLYRAYANSHYRKAFELVGLCLVYLAFGKFDICKEDPSEDKDIFAHEFCTTGQGFGVQTFAIWTISVLWLLSPFIFNTDGLDWEKTKADIKAWAVWMYADEDYKDEDAPMCGGWIGWWKSELSLFHNSKPIARFTVILRESRHFILMWYVIALEWRMITVAFVFGAVVATVFLLGFFGAVGSSMKNFAPLTRAALYLVFVLALMVAFFMTTTYGLDASFRASLALFFGYMGGLYGVNEMARMWSFADSSITSVGMFQQLAFLFDFLFCVSMIIPLFVMSGIPFLNIIQTRMMYNKGFSQVVSASSQYAFSLAAFMGILGGGGCGWLFQLMTTLESSPGFISYVTTYKLLDGKAGNGSTTYVFYFMCIAGVLLAAAMNYFIGRRLAIVAGGLLSVLGMVSVSAVQTAGQGFLFPGVGLLGGAVGVLLPTLTLYIYEISTREMRGKAVLLLGCGFVVGVLAAAWFSSSVHEIGWVWQVFVATIILSIMTPAVYIFPESPYWVYMREGLESCERCLTILRRKEGVSEELKAIREEETAEQTSGAASYKFLLGLFLMLISGLSLGALNMYLSQLFQSIQDLQSMFVNCMVLQLVGAIFSFFFIDRVDHRRILFATLIPIALLVGLLGFQTSSQTWTGDARSILLQIVGLLLYFFLGLGTSSTLWVSSVGLFPTRQRVVTSAFYFVVFFLCPVLSLYMRSNAAQYKRKEYVYLYLLSGVCVVALGLLVGAGTQKNGMLCTKEEMEAERQRLRRLRASRRSARTPGSARSRNLSRSRTKSHSRSNYHLYESPHGT